MSTVSADAATAAAASTASSAAAAEVSFGVNAVKPGPDLSKNAVAPFDHIASLASKKKNANDDPFGRFGGFGGQKKQADKPAESSPALVDRGGISSNFAPGAVGLKILPERGLRGIRHGFIATVLRAFADHHPLVLRPQHFHFLVAQGVAEHVNDNAEKLRSKFVAHADKTTLIVERDDFKLDRAGSNDWAGVVCAPDGFKKQLAANTVEGVMQQLCPSFSNTTPTENVAMGVCAMSAMQKFFAFEVHTRCGFPSITLEGTAEDWELLAAAAPQLVRDRCLPELAAKWVPALESVLPRIAATAKKQHAAKAANEKLALTPEEVSFWQSFCKPGGMSGSGGYDWLRGWVNCLLGPSNNQFCVPFNPEGSLARENGQVRYFDHFASPGPNPDERGPPLTKLPSGECSAPVTWKYLGKEIPLEFRAGFFPCVDEKGRLEPAIGYYIVNEKAILPAAAADSGL